LILLHGLGDDHRVWRRTLPGLIVSRRVILYDLRGHGASSLGQPAGTLGQLGDDLDCLLDALGLERALIVGFSLGGAIAMRAALDHPDRVSGLVLVATSSRVGRVTAEWYSQRAAMVDANDPGLRKTLDDDVEQMYPQTSDEVANAIAIRRQSTADPRGYRNACVALAELNQRPLDPELSRISSPTLIVASDADPLCPLRAAEIMLASMPGSLLSVIKGAGHVLPVERPAELARAILDFAAMSGT
jgi:3-oxoadipate enol-lactonase